MLIQSSPQLTPSVQVESPRSPPRGLFDRTQSRSPERIDTSAFAKVKDLVSQHSSRSSTRASTPGNELADMAPPVPNDTRPRSKSPVPPPINRAEKPKIPAKPQNIVATSDQGLATRPLAFLNDRRVSPFSTPPSSDEEQVPVETPKARTQFQQPMPPPRRSIDALSQNLETSQVVPVKQTSPVSNDPRLMGFAAPRAVTEQRDARSLGFSSAQPPPQPDRATKNTSPPARALPPISAPPRDARDLGFGASTPTSRRASEQLPDRVSPPRQMPPIQNTPTVPPRDARQFGFGGSTAPNTPIESKPELPQRSASKAAPPRPSEESKRPTYNPAISRPAPRIPAQPAPEIRAPRTDDPSRHAIPAPIDTRFPPPPKRGTFNDADILHHDHLEPPSATLTRRRSFDVNTRADDSDEYEEFAPEPSTARHDYPDASHANRRPPRSDAKNCRISSKLDGKGFDICGNLLCAASYHTQVFDLSTGEELLHISHGETVKTTTVVFKPGADIRAEGKRVWIGNNLGDLQEIDLETKVTIATSSAHNRAEIFKILRHHKDLWTLDEAGKLLVWQGSERNGGVPDLKAAPITQKLLAKPNFAMRVQDTLWVSTGKETRVYHPGNEAAFNVRKGPLQLIQGAGDVTCGTYSETTGTVYLGHIDGKVSMYSLKDYSCIGHMKVSDYKINAMAIVADKLWAVYKTGKAYVYNISTTPWKVEKDWKAHDGPATGLLLDPSSVWLLGRLQVATIGYSDQYVKLWDGMLEDDWVESNMNKRDTEYCTFREVRASITTWNCGATIPALVKNNHFIADAIHAEEANPPEILVFGFQEVVDLEDRKVTAKSIFGFNKKKESASTDQQYQSRVYREWRDHLARLINKYLPQHSYSELHTSSLIGLLQCVFVRTNERRNIQNIAKQDVKCGMGGHYGNKGALVCRFTLDSSSLCFINCHLAAGQSQTMHRNNDVATILESEGLPHEDHLDTRSSLYVGGGDGRQILDHEICILNGDLNYRIDTLPRQIIVKHIENRDLSKLLERDQLNLSRRRVAGFRLAPFTELPLTFAPTYKYDVGTDRYDSSEKKRSPAWCDRILYRSPGGRVKQTEYRRHEGVYESDHRPVSGVFNIRIKKVDEAKRKVVLESVDADFKKMRKTILEDGCVRYLVNSFGLEQDVARALIRRAK